MFPAQGAGAPQQQAAPQQPSPWQPPQQQGFQPPQQQGFQPPRPPGPPPSAAPNPYAQQPAPNPYAQQQAPNPYAQQPAPNPYGQAPNPYGQQPAPNPYQPQPAAAAPSMGGAGPKKSSKGLVIGLAVAAVAVAGGVVAFIMLRGGGGASGGDSRDAVVKATLAAMADGSVDGLVKLSDPERLYAKMVDCEGKTPKVKSEMDRDEDDKDLTEKEKEERDPKKVLEKQKKEFGEIVKLTKGAKIELVEIIGKEPPAPSDDEKKDKDDDDDEKRNNGFVMKRGQRLMKGCVAKAPVRIAEVKLKVKVTPVKEKDAIEQETEMMMLQVGKGWWLLGPPTLNVGAAALLAEVTKMRDETCACKDAACAKKLKEAFKGSPRAKEMKKQIKALPDEDRDKIKKIDDEMDACDRKLGGGEMLAALTQFKDKMCACQDKTCAEKVSQEMTVWAKSHMDEDKPDTEMMKEASEVTEQLSKCMMKAYEEKSGGGIGATIGEVGGVAGSGPSGLPQSCTDYRNYLVHLSTCDKLPPASRDAFKQSLKTMDDAWGNLGNLPESARKTMDDACQQGLDATKKASASLGC